MFGGSALRGEAEGWNLAVPRLFDMHSVLHDFLLDRDQVAPALVRHMNVTGG